jgi:hypothetical protein
VQDNWWLVDKIRVAVSRILTSDALNEITYSETVESVAWLKMWLQLEKISSIAWEEPSLLTGALGSLGSIPTIAQTSAVVINKLKEMYPNADQLIEMELFIAKISDGEYVPLDDSPFNRG